MRHCIFYIDKSRIFAGAEQCLAELARHLDRTRFEPILCFNLPLQHQVRFESSGARLVRRVDGARFWTASDRWTGRVKGARFVERWLYAAKLGGILRRLEPAIVHVNLLRSSAYADLLTAKRCGAATVGHVRSLNWQVRIARRTLALCDALICTSDCVRRGVTEWTDAKKVYRVYDPVDGRSFEFFEGQAIARRRLGLPRDAEIIASIATIAPRKGHDVAVRAFAAIAREWPASVLLIVGGAISNHPLDDDSARLERLVRQHGLENRVRFLGHVGDVAAVYAAGDLVYALSRDGEAFGRVPLEAAAARRPVIATAAGATPELVLDGETGLLVPTEEVLPVVEATRRLLRDEEMRSRLVECAAKRVELFSASAHAAGVEDVYDVLLGRGARSAVRGDWERRDQTRPTPPPAPCR